MADEKKDEMKEEELEQVAGGCPIDIKAPWVGRGFSNNSPEINVTGSSKDQVISWNNIDDSRKKK